MSEDQYLWDRTGEADPEVMRLEGLLAKYRDSGRKYETNPKAAWRWLAAGAACILVGFVWLRLRTEPTEWNVTMGSEAARRVVSGQWIQTDNNTGAKLRADAVGEVELRPGSNLEVVKGKGHHHQFVLHRGILHAFIWAPPERFVVDTPSARAVDLGCEYTLEVSADGSGLLTVQVGWVAFQAGNAESFLPAGAACRTNPNSGPGIPYLENSSPEFRNALTRGDIDGMLASSRLVDAYSLWHLILRTDGETRHKVVQRFTALVRGQNQSALERLDPTAVDAAWDALGLGPAQWWRTWKRDWSGSSSRKRTAVGGIEQP